jgi:hypothetical protein
VGKQNISIHNNPEEWFQMKILDDEELIKTLELARKIGCEESFLVILLKEVKRRNL